MKANHIKLRKAYKHVKFQHEGIKLMETNQINVWHASTILNQ